HHFADQVIGAIKKNNGWGSNIVISDEKDELLDTGGGLLKAKDLFRKGERFITCNADILTDLDLNKLISFHQHKNALITLGITDRKTSRYLLFNDENRMVGWRNKSTGEEKISLQTHPPIFEKAYSCVAVFEYEIFGLIPFKGKFSL